MSRSRRGRFATVGAARRRARRSGWPPAGTPSRRSAAAAGAPGVTATQINVGSIANVTGPLSSGFAPVVNGVQAYFSMINAEGGVDGRKLKLAYQEDDQGSPTADLSVAQQLVQQDHVFAVVGVGTPFFGGASYLAQQGTPTFGYAVSTDWQDRPTLFADYGSVLCFPCGAPGDAYLAQQLGAKSIAVVAYGVPQSAAACKAAITGMRAFGLNVSFTDLNLVFGGDPTPDVLQMKNDNVDLLFSCLDVNGNVALRPGHQPERPHHEAGVVQRLRPEHPGAVRVDHERGVLRAAARALRSGPGLSRRVPGARHLHPGDAEVPAQVHLRRGGPRRVDRGRPVRHRASRRWART